MTGITIACLQLCSGRDIDRNIATTVDLARKANARGAHYIQTPEVTTLLETDRQRLFETVEPEDNNRALAAFSNAARDLKVWLHIGSMAVKQSHDKLANRAYLFNPKGDIASCYDKIHMFDVKLGDGQHYRESKNYAAGSTVPVVKTPWGNLALTICYDMRFPALYRSLAQKGAQILTAPSAFTRLTGKAHWHTLLRSRAIENGAFMVAAAQSGDHECGRQTYGHSIIIGPWGDILAQESTGAVDVIMADIDIADAVKARNAIPSLRALSPFNHTLAS